MIARVPDDSDARYCFRLRCLEISRNVVVNCRKLFFVYKKLICSCFKLWTDQSLVSQESESVYSYMRLQSAFCQTRSLETRLWVSARLRMIIWIRLCLLNVKWCALTMIRTQSGGNFSDDWKSLLKRFRLGRQGKGSVIPFQHRYVLFAVKVSRMELVAIYNTSGTDNWLSNRRKCRNSPFWSKERDGIVLKKYGGAGRGCTKEDSVLFSSSILCWSVFVSKMTKMSENPRRSFL